MLQKIKIYCDGAYSSSRKQGGWAYVILKNGEKIHHNFYPEADTTNNRMEIKAALEACKWCKLNNYKDLNIITDSMYVIGTMSLNWKRNKNHDLWFEFDEVVKDLNIIWEHVKGHSGNKYNELCDGLAVAASKSKL